ncbi:release factor glutamine methyltransferase [Halioglobus japonicus]|uniref:Release factor glutamine methyltransferase n=1 Tax=Halioglobus japonicus TaxID=930805 RepID=A0AAP8SM46_9GAMM|nr:peptide chain release factor N(5)-glutamine methyltransferase [Halioglobus japonicus]PLW84663.1 peptide chain release factor N(5)-glutamine methyltransferase [Halioglobus japonicus]GHD23127.1 release factor glutamine methyltransferase [Halioglobus japonicus]
MATVAELLQGVDDLPGDSPRRDLEVLLGHCLAKSRTWLYTWPEAAVEGETLAQFQALLARRKRGEPVAHLTGQREFWSLDLEVNPSTLIPRPDTETLVEWALELPLDEPVRALDLGTGTGAIALALAHSKPGWQITATDASTEAVALALRNARRCQLEQVVVLESDWFSALSGEHFDLIVSNPPYIAPGDPHLSQGDVRFEPDSALVAAAQGLADLAHLCANAGDYLTPGGWLLLEHGYDQAPAVRQLLTDNGFSAVMSRRDLGGHERISGGQLSVE